MKTITVKELIDTLAQYPPDLEVVVAKDAAGNGHLPLGERMGVCHATEVEGQYGLRVIYEDDWEDWKEELDLDEDAPYPGDNALVIGP